MLFSYGYGQQQIGDNNNCWQIAGDFDCHADAGIQYGVHRPIEHVQGFTRSHSVCRHRADACAVSPRRPSWSTNSSKQHWTLTKHNFSLATTLLLIAGCLWEFHTQNGPSTQLINGTSCVKMWNATIGAIKRCERTKIGKVIKRSWSSIYKLAHMCHLW